METENKAKKRPQVNALYCSAEIADAVNNHPYFTGCITGADRAAKILEALDFAAEWKGRTGDLEKNDGLANDLKDAKAQFEDMQRKYNEKSTQYEELALAYHELQEKQDEAITTNADAQKVIEDRDRVIKQLQEANEQLKAAGNKNGWDVVRTQIDPAYAAVLEELTDRLIKKFGLQDLEPHVVLITFFMQYYYNQEWEFSGMPFVIKPSEILTIVQSVYPEMSSKVLSQALRVKK